MILSDEAYKKFMVDIQSRIDHADRLAKEKAEAILTNIAEENRLQIMKRVDLELGMEDVDRKAGNVAGAEA